MVSKAIHIVLAAFFGVAITFILFYFMQMLVGFDGEVPEMGEARTIGQITIPEQEIEVQRQEAKPDEPEVIEDIPDLPEENFQLDAPSNDGLSLARIDVDVGGLDTAASLSAGDGEFLPIVTVAPQYPQRAASRGIEGWCQVMFTVTENGTVIDPVVVDAEPENIFNSASTRAVMRFKFNPRIVDGAAVSVPGVQYVFRYNLED